MNALNFDKFSPLDITEGFIPEIPSSIKHALEENGAVLNVFWQAETQSTSDFHIYFTCILILILKSLAKTVSYHNTENLYFLKDLTLIDTCKERKFSEENQQGRTALHLMANSFYEFSLLDGKCPMDVANTIIDKLISLGCSVNEPTFSETPLHYANTALWKFFISKGADALIKDKDGNIAIDITSRHISLETSDIVKAIRVRDRNDETYLFRLMNDKKMEMNVQDVDDSNGDSDYGDSVSEFSREELNLDSAPELLWKKGKYAFRHPLVEKITKEVTDLMEFIAKEIERLDSRFEIRLEFGSFNEGTRLGTPDEFAFCFVLKRSVNFAKFLVLQNFLLNSFV